MTARTLPKPSGVALLRSMLGVGSPDEGTARLHSSPFTGHYDYVAFSRASLWEGRFTFGARSHEDDALFRAWVQEARGNVLSIPVASIDRGVNDLPPFPSITAAARQSDGAALLTLAANPDPAWQGRLIHLAGRMARVVAIESATARIFPAVIPAAFPADVERNGHFLFQVMDIDGGERRNWGVDDITISFVEALGAAQPVITVPDNTLYWMDRAVRWNGLPVVWDTDETGLLEFDGRLVYYGNRLVEWRP